MRPARNEWMLPILKWQNTNKFFTVLPGVAMASILHQRRLLEYDKV